MQLHPGIAKSFKWLLATDLNAIMPGKYFIEAEDIFAMVQQYETPDAATEQMEVHRKYIDVQYIVQGEELAGLALLHDQPVSKPYDAETDFMLAARFTFFFCSFISRQFYDLLPCVSAYALY